MAFRLAFWIASTSSRHLRDDVGARPVILIAAILADAVALAAFLVLRDQQDPVVVVGAVTAVAAIFAFEALYLRHRNGSSAGSAT